MLDSPLHRKSFQTVIDDILSMQNIDNSSFSKVSLTEAL